MLRLHGGGNGAAIRALRQVRVESRGFVGGQFPVEPGTEEIDRFSKGLSSMLDTNSIGLNASIKNIESSTAVLKTLANDLQAGKGPAGTLLKNEQLSADVSQIAYNLNIATSNLNRLGLWGILWKHKPPKTNAPPPHARTSPPGKNTAD